MNHTTLALQVVHIAESFRCATNALRQRTIRKLIVLPPKFSLVPRVDVISLNSDGPCRQAFSVPAGASAGAA
jgi:hypothetical protein